MLIVKLSLARFLLVTETTWIGGFSNELFGVVTSMKNRNLSGMDGLPCEFYKAFYHANTLQYLSSKSQ